MTFFLLSLKGKCFLGNSTAATTFLEAVMFDGKGAVEVSRER